MRTPPSPLGTTEQPAFSRRDCLLWATAALATLPGWPSAQAARIGHAGAASDLSLWYQRPAQAWVEAMPVGNGRMGAMVFGRVQQERLQLNEDSLWSGGPYNPNNPAALAALPKVRALIDAEQWAEATELVDKALMGTPKWQMPYGAAGDLLLDFEGLQEPQDYRRWLDLDAATAITEFSSGGSQHRREVFCSSADNVLVLHLQATGPQRLNLRVSHRHAPKDVHYGAASSDPKTGAVALQGAPWNHTEPPPATPRPADLQAAADGPGAWLLSGRNWEALGVPGALRWALRVQATGDGQIEVDAQGLHIRNARTVTLHIGLATSFRSPSALDGDPLALVRLATQAAAARGVAQLRQRHAQAHQALFRRLSIRLGEAQAADRASQRPTNERIAAAQTALEPALAALYVQYGRYLLLSSSRPGSQPANLQGLWNEGLNPPWGSKYTININTEMNYWLAGPGHLDECFEPLLRMVEELAVSGARTARDSYGARGWMAHHNTDLWRASAPIDGHPWGMWPMGGAWLCLSLWDHYEYQPSPALLRRLYPLLRGSSEFFVSSLVEDPKGRGLVTSPSLSPENPHRDGVAICAGPAMDRQILRDLFDATLQAHELLGRPDAALAESIKATRARLPQDRIGAQGQLQEWLEDWDAQAPDQHHRHVSHLYAVYPSGQINVRDTPELAQAARVTLNTRGDYSTGWATAWRLALWARLGDGERALGILRGLLGPVRTYPNMFDSHPPFQIDGNFGGAAGILEMVVQSWGGEIHLLPALPALFAEGELRGVRARGGIEVDLAWANSQLTRLVLRGQPRAKVRLHLGQQHRVVTLDKQGQWRLRGNIL